MLQSMDPNERSAPDLSRGLSPSCNFDVLAPRAFHPVPDIKGDRLSLMELFERGVCAG